ncbi:hypothetical protein ACU639_00625 [Streptomyces cynarae]|uniref:hypothetical protein n=1 Tax=Streptomyces cynarae TaxID=2981134 RepID=UPI00406CE9AA
MRDPDNHLLVTRRTTRRPLASHVAAPRKPVDPAPIGRRVARSRAKDMDAAAVARALEEASLFPQADPPVCVTIS